MDIDLIGMPETWLLSGTTSTRGSRVISSGYDNCNLGCSRAKATCQTYATSTVRSGAKDQMTCRPNYGA
eukprot:5934163-Pyramimonas_sp.AAC.1